MCHVACNVLNLSGTTRKADALVTLNQLLDVFLLDIAVLSISSGVHPICFANR